MDDHVTGKTTVQTARLVDGNAVIRSGRSVLPWSSLMPMLKTPSPASPASTSPTPVIDDEPGLYGDYLSEEPDDDYIGDHLSEESDDDYIGDHLVDLTAPPATVGHARRERQAEAARQADTERAERNAEARSLDDEHAKLKAEQEADSRRCKEIAALESRMNARHAVYAAKMDALLAHDDDEVKPPSWLIEGVIADRAITLLIGKQGHGKSTIAESIVQAVATGRDWLGRFKTRQAKVLVVQLEMPRALDESFRDRIAAGSGGNLAEVKGGVGRTYMQLRLDKDASDKNVLDPWMTSETLSDLIAHVGAELVVIDSLSRAHEVASENDNALDGRCHA